MSILTSASGKSVYRGYEYFIENRVLFCEQVDEFEFEGAVKGSMQEPYNVHINLKKIRSSSCDCPFANGRKICKHMVALFFAAFPDEARQYKAELDAYYKEEERREAEIEIRLHNFVKKLSKSELQELLLQVLYDGPEWQFERFVNEFIEW